VPSRQRTLALETRFVARRQQQKSAVFARADETPRAAAFAARPWSRSGLARSLLNAASQ
jgi:hypothetical protein